MPRQRQAISAMLLMLAGVTVRADTDPALSSYQALIEAGKFAEASGGLETYVASHPQSWQAFYQLGYSDFRLHRIQQSLAMLCKSLVLNKDFAESHKILAYDLNILGRQDYAIRELNEAIRCDPASAESHYELGRILYERGSYLKAIEQLEKTHSLAPGYVRAYHNLGLAYSAVGDNKKAVANFEEGLRLNAAQTKPSAWPLIDYATYFNLQNNFEKARDLLLQAIKIENMWDQEYDELSKAYRGLGQIGPSIEALKRAVALNPRKAEYHYVLARLYTQTKQPVEAKQELTAYENQKSRETK
jgi:tetratricopeptide (TPR) repeat protein